MSAVELSSSWFVARYDGPDDGKQPDVTGLTWISATVPGAVNYDALAAGMTPNPYASSRDAAASQWVAQTDWVYQISFDAGPSRWTAVEFDGIDTYADVFVNGLRIGSTDNAYRSWQFPLPPGLLMGQGNSLVVRVKSHFRMIAPALPEARRRIAVQGGHEYRMIKSLVRRYQRNSFSNSSLLNLGVHVLGIGIYKPVRLVDTSARLGRTHAVMTQWAPDRAVVRIDVSCAEAHGLEVAVELRNPGGGEVVAGTRGIVQGGVTSIELEIADPQRWWPRGYGEPRLYPMQVRLFNGGQIVDERSVSVGLRTVELVQNEDGAETFQLKVNGVPIYVRGTNLVPVDYLRVHGSAVQYDRLLRLIDDGGYNLVRLWGGGAVESDDLFAWCDEHGVMLWQDLFLHSNTYPDYDPSFVASFRAEAAELLVRMREHPALVLVCGGNEQQEGWDEWNWPLEIDWFYGSRLAFGVGGEVAASLCPELPFIPNSPYGQPSAQSPVAGDTHTWGNFINATKDPRFVTETCWTQESYSQPATLREVMGLDVDALDDRQWPTQWTRLTGRPVLNKFPYSSMHGFRTLRDYLRGLDVEQALADQQAIGMLRLRSGSCSGVVYWSLNKGGPLFQFGSVDYGGRPMMSHYVLKRLFGDVVVGIYRDIDQIRVVAVNATGGPVDASVTVRWSRVDGTLLDQWSAETTVSPGRVTRVLDVGAYRQVRDRRREFFHAELRVAGEAVSQDMLLLCPIADVASDGVPEITNLLATPDGRWWVDLTAAELVTWTSLESEQRLLFSDDFFPLLPGETRRIRIERLPGEQEPTPTMRVAGLGLTNCRLVELPTLDGARP